MPTVDQAIRRLTFELRMGRTTDLRVLKIIHGYGSSGTGGRLRVELRRYLDDQVRRGLIKRYVMGEKFSIFDEGTRELLQACGALRADRDLERFNNGVTFILLK